MNDQSMPLQTIMLSPENNYSNDYNQDYFNSITKVNNSLGDIADEEIPKSKKCD